MAGVLLHALFEVNQSPATATPFRVATHLLLAAVALVAVRGYVRCARTRTGRSRAGYTFAAATSLLWAVSEVIRTSSESVVPTSSAAVGAALLSLMAVICAIVGFGMAFPSFADTAVRLRRTIDGLMIFFALLLLGWYTVLGPTFRATVSRGGEAGQAILVLAAVALLCITMALALLVLSRTVSAGINQVSLLAGSMLVYAAVGIGYGSNLAFGRDWWELGVGGGHLLAGLLSAMASHMRPPVSSSIEDQQSSPRALWFPNVPVLIAFGIAAIQQATEGTMGPVIPWLVLGVAVLVLVRQFLNTQTNQALLRQISYQANHDMLTGLGNRALFTTRTNQAAAMADEHSGVAVILLDLDGFKGVNDTYGHAAGDELLRTAAERIQVSVREEDTVARLGGDEFVIMLSGLSTVEHAVRVAERTIDDLRQPLVIADTAMTIRSSAGVTISHGGGDDVDSLLHQADLALYQAKADGKGVVRRYHPALHHANVPVRPGMRRDDAGTILQAGA
ncbi:GGDEF domain-containing protein [Actinoplanes teichomyceticus]|uniref:GGDEF domain-containing protein n=1 Tax=Actinoplanes teichomyceticus TaxID=1867 RepID=UPI0011A73CCD|nr:GGDEF domain-containing protein [Actinoplanes teichomyceticus]